MARKKRNNQPPRESRWVVVWEVKHWRSGRMIRRRDGLPFRFMIG